MTHRTGDLLLKPLTFCGGRTSHHNQETPAHWKGRTLFLRAKWIQWSFSCARNGAASNADAIDVLMQVPAQDAW